MSFYSDFAEHYEKIFPFREPTYEFLRRHLPTAGHILDIGCGTGHYCGRFADAGLKVTGIDLDSNMIARAEEQYAAPRFETMDMLELATYRERFDAAYCIGNVVAHVPATALSDFLTAVSNVLTPGAIWVVQMVNFDPLLTQPSYTFKPLSLDGGKTTFLREYRNITAERLWFCTRLESDGTPLFAGKVELHPILSDAFIQAHSTAGFALTGHWSDFGGTPFVSETNSGSVFVFRRTM
ncbi:MAG: class I SAM-dependent methyltransferase [bacterium]|nr:class I SAM-dependent methyltransferase [bacterium]